MSNFLRYSDNGQDVVIRIDGDAAEIDALAKRFDQAAAAEVAMGMKRSSDDMLDKLIGVDDAWVSNMADRLHEVIRDADLEIRRLNRRCNALIGGGLCIASGCLVAGILIGGWLL